MTATQVTVAGEELQLFAERAGYWPARATLLVADPHFGKAAAFRLAGLFVPRGTTAAGLSRLSHLLEATGARRIIFLGDFLHAREGRSAEMFEAVGEWRRRHSAVEMLLVRGNHDRRAGDPPGEVGIDVAEGPVAEGPFALAHHPVPVPGSYVLAGHIHPCITVRGKGKQRERLACFWLGRETGVLPAFGEFTGCAEITPDTGDRVWVVAGSELIQVR